MKFTAAREALLKPLQAVIGVVEFYSLYLLLRIKQPVDNL